MLFHVVLCSECKVEVATKVFAHLPLCQACYDKLVAAYNQCMIYSHWAHVTGWGSQMVLEAKDVAADRNGQA